MAQLFETTKINGLQLGNRLVRSATWEGMAGPDGRINDRLVDFYSRLAEGGVGLIISSYLFIRADGRQYATQIGAYGDELVPGLARLAEAVHGSGGRLVGQIVHCGGQARRAAINGQQPVAPSAVESPGYPEVPRALSGEEVEQVVQDFAAAAGRLQAAGFDGVQLHGAHGYLLAQFLSPLRNRRDDRWGGSREARARLGLATYRAVRARVGLGFPVMIKLNAHDFLEGSTTEQDAAYLVSALAREGLDAVEVSGGTPGSGKLGAARVGIETVEDEAYFLPQARVIREAAPGLRLMLVGGLRSPQRMEEILAEGVADYLSICRPLIREPDLPARWRRGDLRRAECISCSGCFKPARKGEGVRCVQIE